MICPQLVSCLILFSQQGIFSHFVPLVHSLGPNASLAVVSVGIQRVAWPSADLLYYSAYVKPVFSSSFITFRTFRSTCHKRRQEVIAVKSIPVKRMTS